MTTLTAPVRPAMAEHCACDSEELNSLLRGELSAVETYQQAIAKFENWTTASDLSLIRDEHAFAASVLRRWVIDSGGSPATSSGTWGAFATLVAGTAKLLGPQTVLAALREGEELGYAAYERALENPDIPGEQKLYIRDEFMKQCERHIGIVGRLLQDAG